MIPSGQFFDTPRAFETIEDDIERSALMTSEEVVAELRRHGIDPRPTIEAVTKLVEERLRAWRGLGAKKH